MTSLGQSNLVRNEVTSDTSACPYLQVKLYFTLKYGSLEYTRVTLN